jgi:hypothetical protein
VTVDQVANPNKGRKKKRKRLGKLAAGLDTDWLVVVSRLPIENCAAAREEEPATALGAIVEYLCDRRWEDLKPTEERAVRFCEGCRHNVHYCDTIMEAREHAWQGHCIAVDLGVIRRPDDLAGVEMVMGLIRPGAIWEEEERMKPDAVSAERERRKRMGKQ